MEKNFLAVIDALGQELLRKNLEISALKFENEQLKKKIEAIENYCNKYQEEQIC